METDKMEMTKAISSEEMNSELEAAPDESPTVTYKSLSRSDKILFNIAFITGGISGFIMWNCILNSIVSRQHYLWPGEKFTPLLGACEAITGTITTVLLYWCNGLSIKLIYAGGLMSLLATILFPTVCVVYSGLENLRTAKALLMCLCLMDGVANGLFSVVSLSFASIIPFSHVIPLGSCGIGVAGITAFSSYLVLSQYVFPQTLEGQTPLLFTFFSIATCLILVHLTTFTVTYRRPWFDIILKKALLNREETWGCSNLCSTPFNAVRKKFRSIKNAKLDRAVTEVLPQDSKEPLNNVAPIYKTGSMDKPCSTDLSTTDQNSSSSNIDIIDDKSDKSSPPARHIKLVLKDCWPQLLIGGITTAITASTFPSPGPEGWDVTPTMKTLLIGTFQVFNMIMRFAPAWKPLRIPFNWFVAVVLLRLGFIPLFLTPGRWGKGIAFWSHPGTLITLMFVFTAINGWAVTLATMYATGAVDNPKEKAIVSKILVISYAAAMVVGFTVAFLIT